ncbi:protein kinase [Pseudomonas sp. CrR7]|nr:protein kinase [Pseudomonas sp. CM27]NQD74986.1 protein kinase [Pseudomonas sp. CM27]
MARLSRNRIRAWTPAHAAPELLDGARLSTASDLFAAACVIYELAGGKQPFGHLGARAMGKQHPGQSLDRPANLPAKVWPALRQALALDPAARQSGARVLQQALVMPPLSLLRRWFGQPEGYLADTESPHVQP